MIRATTLLLLLPSSLLADEWRSLFNGKDLDGWTPKITGQDFGEDKAKTFRVEDGLLKVGYDGYKEFKGQFGHLIFTFP